MSAKINALVQRAFEHGGSDVHLVEDGMSYVRVNGTIVPAKGIELTKEELETFLKTESPDDGFERFQELRSLDFAWQPGDDYRLRVAAYYERRKIRIVMRVIKLKIMTLEELNLPPVISEIAEYHRGIVLVTGVTGSGKSTTLAAMVNHINSSTRRCIITIEDPIESVHENIQSLISQREVRGDVKTFRDGLIQALRQDPDIILIGEMRDQETIGTGISASETGHFVLSTMHTTNATHTVERIFSEFPEAQHDLLREQIGANLRATITQRLVKLSDGKGRAAGLEIMVVNQVIQKLILENRVESIATIIRGRTDGMQLFDQALADLVKEERVTEEDAIQYAEDEFAFKRYVRGIGGSGDAGGIIG